MHTVPELLLAAVKQNWTILKIAPEGLTRDLDFMMQAIEIDDRASEYAHEELKPIIERAILQKQADMQLIFSEGSSVPEEKEDSPEPVIQKLSCNRYI